MGLRWDTCWAVLVRFSHIMDITSGMHESLLIHNLQTHLYVFVSEWQMTLYLGVSVFVHFRVRAVVHAKWVCALPWMFLPSLAVGQLISQLLPAKSVAGPAYGPLVLILAQMIDSPGAETTCLALWLAVNTLRVTPCHQERKGRGKKAMKETRLGRQVEKERAILS